MDNKEPVAGTTLYPPIHVDGALFSTGDGHGAQGDGEVCITAIETGLIETFEFHLRDDMTLEWPLAETPTHNMIHHGVRSTPLRRGGDRAARHDQARLRAHRTSPRSTRSRCAAWPPTCA